MPGPSTWWAPGARGWWIGILFGVGSALFALGAVPGYASAVGVRTDSITFFIGSLFFTSAGFLQYRESVDAGAGGPPRGWKRVLAYRPEADRLVGHGDPAGRHALLQHQHGQRPAHRPEQPGSPPAHLAARRLRIGVLPRGQRTGVVRGLPRVAGLVAPELGVVDHPGQSGRVAGLRGLSRRLLHRPVHGRRSGTSNCPTSAPSSAPSASSAVPCSCCRNGPNRPRRPDPAQPRSGAAPPKWSWSTVRAA